MPEPTPLLIVSDGISASSGLARIARDLSTRIHQNLSDVYRVATAGYGASGSRHLAPFQYHLETDGWILPNIAEIVQDWAGEERCIVMFIWDLNRLGWFSQPDRLGSDSSLVKYPGLKQWLSKANIERWIYCPIDSTGLHDTLSFPLTLTAKGFDRIIAYGSYGEGVLRASLGNDEADKRHMTALPHGIDTDVFYALPKQLSRKLFFSHTGAKPLLAMLGVNPRCEPLAEDEILIGCVATNQDRKDWALACETVGMLAKQHKIRFWVHTDDLERNWSIPNLLVDCGVLDNTVISMGHMPDEKMATAYSACDLTIGPGSEGWGYPLGESLACETPVIHGSYAGGADVVPQAMQVDPIGFKHEGSYSSKRPVYNAADWAAKATQWFGKKATLDDKYTWSVNWVAWEKYLREAVCS